MSLRFARQGLAPNSTDAGHMLKLASTSWHFLRHRFERFLVHRRDCPVFASYQSGCTPITPRETFVVGGERVTRAGSRASELLLHRLFARAPDHHQCVLRGPLARLGDNAVSARVHMALPAVDLEVINDIPLGKGLGSSAAALTAGVVMAEKLLGLGWKVGRILDEAARLEGHPDNVAACVLGAIAVSAVEPGGLTRSIRMEMPDRFQIAVVVPNYQLPTKEARAVLPETYSRADVTFNIQRATLLIAALANGDPSGFPTALDDRMHQPFRAPLVPGLSEILRLRAPGLLGCALSGAGPSVLVFHEKGYAHVVDLVRQVFAMNGCTTEVVSSGISTKGYELL